MWRQKGESVLKFTEDEDNVSALTVSATCSFLVVSLSGFGIRVMLIFKNRFESAPTSSVFLREFEKD